MEVEVEILDVTDEEARTLLLSIDPLAALAQTQEQLRNRLQELAPTVSAELQAAWTAAAQANLKSFSQTQPRAYATIPEQHLILVTCRDEQHQVELLGRFQTESLECRALLS
jgi:hypothetical protein